MTTPIGDAQLAKTVNYWLARPRTLGIPRFADKFCNAVQCLAMVVERGKMPESPGKTPETSRFQARLGVKRSQVRILSARHEGAFCDNSQQAPCFFTSHAVFDFGPRTPAAWSTLSALENGKLLVRRAQREHNHGGRKRIPPSFVVSFGIPTAVRVLVL
jgi:hypothetical protein